MATGADLTRTRSWLIYLPYLFLIISVLHFRALRKRVAPKNVPWVGLRKEWFAQYRAHWRELKTSKKDCEDGYAKYSKVSKPFLTSNSGSFQPEVVLPPAHIKWLIDQPESVVSIYNVLIDDVEFTYQSPRSWKFSRPFHVEALNKMRLDLMTAPMVNEIDICLDKIFGSNTKEWTKVSVRTATHFILSRITNRVFVGEALAHDERYYNISTSFFSSLGETSLAIKLLIPSSLKPILGYVFALRTRYYDWRCSQSLIPTIKKHLADAESRKHSHDEVRNPDMLQLMARFAVRSSDPIDHDPRSLCSRILALNFVGIHTSSAAAMNAFLDIAAGGPSVHAALRHEASTVLREAGGTWTKPAVAKLVLLDSTLRESLRFSAFKARGVERQIIAKRGVTLPDGTYLPYGTKVGMPTTEIHKDAAFYDRPDEFVFDRFVAKAELGMVNTTDTFLAFGHGRHACPGRFFSTHELKLLFAQFVLNYDIKFFSERPAGFFISDFWAQPDAELEVRRVAGRE
ncbi:cytochrome P450 [Saccharata proteae CBS 121410]|uniref:Cytochrome P450 n=1 Tax=Saccharata proteae CBS 121410 TaxID=1314787 RepID=A0A9P4HRL0_9PEZI|nr:cytochrome P450 [Saccharata proteae CBS 121410]